MTRLPQMDAVRFIRALNRAGFVEHRFRGSHLTLKHSTKDIRLTVPRHSGDLDRGLMKAILKQAGLTEDEFRELL